MPLPAERRVSGLEVVVTFRNPGDYCQWGEVLHALSEPFIWRVGHRLPWGMRMLGSHQYEGVAMVALSKRIPVQGLFRSGYTRVMHPADWLSLCDDPDLEIAGDAWTWRSGT